MAFTRIDSDISIVPEIEKDTPIVGIENIHGIKPEKPGIRAYGTTLVNLLGKYGNFEVESGTSGKAVDVGTVLGTPSWVTGIIDSKAQKITQAGGSWGYFYIPFITTDGHTYFLSTYRKTTKDADAVLSYLGRLSLITSGLHTIVELVSPKDTANVWERASGKVISAGVSGYLAFYACSNTSTSGKTYEATFDGVQAIDLTAAGALDPVRQQKYGVANWEDLTEAQLEAEIPYFDSVLSVNVEDGTASELTVENRGKNLANFLRNSDLSIFMQINTQLKVGSTYTLKINNTDDLPDGYFFFFRISSLPGSGIESVLWSLTGTKISTPTFTYTQAMKNVKYPFWIVNYSYPFVSQEFVNNLNIQLEEGTSATDYVPPRTDSITIPDTCELHGFGGYFNEWSGNQYTKRISMESKTTDSSGNLALSGYLSGTKAIVMNDDTGEVQILDVADSIATGWNSQECTVWYVLSTPIVSEVKATGGLYLYEGQNNVLCPDSKLPALIMLTHTAEGTDELLAFVRNFSANARSESIRFKPHFSTKKRTILTRRGYEISFDDPIIDGDWDLRQFEDTRFTIMEELGSEKIKYHGCAITELESSDDDIVIHKVKLIAETKEVV